jgi:hypothetical protein
MIGSIDKRITLRRASSQENEREKQKANTGVKFHHKEEGQTNITENDRFYFVLSTIWKDLLNIIVVFDFV